MAVTTIGVTGTIWGLTSETGMIVQTVSCKSAREKAEVKNATGEVAAVSYYNATQTYAIKAVVAGTVTNAAPGLALTLANKNDGNGVTTGGIYVDDVSLDGSNVAFQELNINATRYPLIA